MRRLRNPGRSLGEKTSSTKTNWSCFNCAAAEGKDFANRLLGKESTYNSGDPGSIPGLGRSTGERIGYPLQYSWASLVAQLERICSVGDLGSISGLGRSPGERKGYPFQYSGLENSVDCIVHGVAKS